MNRKLLLVIFLYSTLMAFAQDGHDFDSTYSPLPGLKGTAQYHYYYDLDHLRVKTGAFHFEAHLKDSSWSKAEEEHNWTGNYSENEKNGEWIYEVKSRQLRVDSITDLQIYYDLNTYKSTLNAYYKHGVPAKTWTYTSYVKTGPGLWEPYEEIEVTISQSMIDGPFTYKRFGDGAYTVSGSASKGLFSGEWLLEYEEDSIGVQEERSYTNGILLSLEREKGGVKTTLDIPYSPQTTAWLEKKTGKGHFTNKPFSLRYNDGYPLASSYITLQRPGEAILAQLLRTLFRFDRTWIKANGLPYGVNQGVYPLSEQEQGYLQSYTHLETELQDVTRDIDRALVLEHASKTDSIYLFAKGWMNNQDLLLDQLKNLRQTLLSNRVQYFYRDELILDYARNLLTRDSIFVNKKMAVVDYGSKNDTTDTFLAFMAYNYSARIEKGQQLFQELKSAEKETDIDKELEIVYERIQEERIELDSIRTNDERVKSFMRNIDHNFLEERIKGQYAVMQDTKNKEDKRALADSIIIELQQIEQIYNLATKSIAMAGYLDSLYTEYVFDAFTFSDNVPSRKKKRLYEDVQEIIFELVALAAKSETPRESLGYVKKIYDTQGVLVYLHDKKTKQIEKDLSRARTLEAKLKILDEVV